MAGAAPTHTSDTPAAPAAEDRRTPRARRRKNREQGHPTLDWRTRLRRDKTLILMTLPAVALLLVFNYAPLVGLVTAFQYYDPLDGIRNSQWAGLAQFTALFHDPLFWGALKNTLVLSFVQLILFFPVPIALAVLLNSVLSERLRNLIQSIVYLPHFFSWVLTITIFQQMLGGAGVLNQALRSHSVGTWDIMTNPHTFALLVTGQAVWKEAGWGIIVFLAALAAIDPALYEAAAVDGSGPWRRMWHITLPGMRGVVVLMLVLRLGNALSVGFEQFLVQRVAVGHNAADVLDTFSFYYGIATDNYGYGAAAGLFKSVISLLLIWGANKLAHAFGEDGLYRR
ncbi:ABC transporter permease [Actinacidiphila yeochonensis]|uniref:ABC transporter permease n=1 Tax=Actinacidiphila yeochonensis TaxID=89050 RepID=UPI0005688132|nr:ABC transporter permease subunit [Actinacidiphila yeochonensis]